VPERQQKQIEKSIKSISKNKPREEDIWPRHSMRRITRINTAIIAEII